MSDSVESAFAAAESGEAPTLADCPSGDFDALSAKVLYGFRHLCTTCGGDPDVLLAKVGISLVPVAGHVPLLTYRQFMRVLSDAATTLQCPDFGMRLALEQAGTQLYGPLGRVMQNSRTFGEALEYVIQHSSIHSSAARISRFIGPDTQCSAFSHEIMVGSFEEQVQAIEYILLAGHLGAGALTNGSVRGRHALFRHRAVSPLAVYHRYFRCDVHFDQRMNALVFSPEDLSMRIVDSDPAQHANLIDTVRANFSGSAPPIHAAVRGIILRQMMIGNATNGLVAAELGVHTRTLHRRLVEAGTSFQKVKDEVRCELAKYYLARTEVSLLWITAKLGFSEQAVFTRFCQRHFGCSPSIMRA